MSRDTSAPGHAGDDSQDPTADLFLAGRLSRLVLTGDIDAAGAKGVAGTFEEAVKTGHPVQVDARHVGFVDSSGLALLARLAAEVPVSIIEPPENLRFLIDLTHLNGRVEIFDADPGFPPPPSAA